MRCQRSEEGGRGLAVSCGGRASGQRCDLQGRPRSPQHLFFTKDRRRPAPIPLVTRPATTDRPQFPATVRWSNATVRGLAAIRHPLPSVTSDWRAASLPEKVRPCLVCCGCLDRVNLVGLTGVAGGERACESGVGRQCTKWSSLNELAQIPGRLTRHVTPTTMALCSSSNKVFDEQTLPPLDP